MGCSEAGRSAGGSPRSLFFFKGLCFWGGRQTGLWVGPLAQLGISRFFIRRRRTDPLWKKHLSVHLIGLTLCLTILIITILEKFTLGGWLTLFITSGVIALCFLTRKHYNKVKKGVRELDDLLHSIPVSGPPNTDPAK